MSRRVALLLLVLTASLALAGCSADLRFAVRAAFAQTEPILWSNISDGPTVDVLIAAGQHVVFDEALGEVRDLVVPLGFNSQSVTQTSDRHWTWSAVKNQ